MPSFEYTPTGPVNPLADFIASQGASNANIAARLQNQLATNTLDSNTQTAANAAESGGLTNQLAREKNPLEIMQLRQQLGLDPSPTLDRLQRAYNGDGGQPSAPAAIPDGPPQAGGNLNGPIVGDDGKGAVAPVTADTARLLGGSGGADVTQPSGPDHSATPLVRVFATKLLSVPAEERPALYQKMLPTMKQAGAIHAPEKYPGDEAIQHLASGGALPSGQVAGPGAPAGAAPPGPDPTQPPPGYLPGPIGGGAPAPQATPGVPVSPSAPAPGPRAMPAAPPPVRNWMYDAIAPDGNVPSRPLNSMAGPPVPAPTFMPAASDAPPQPAQPPAAQTGMNSPQVQQAQALLRRAAQIELIAAQTPNDPRARATAAAMAGDLKQRAAVLMQADSVTVGQNGVQTHSLTGKEDNAAVPTMNYQPDPNNPGVLISPGQRPVVLPPGRPTVLPDKSVGVTGPGGTFKTVANPNLAGISAAETAAAGGKAAAESAAKTKDALIPLARSSGQAIGNIDYGLRQLDQAAKGGIPTGYFAPALATAAAAAKSLGLFNIPGVAPSAVSDIQTASKTLAVVSGAILQNIIGNGEITDSKIEAFIHAQPGIVNDPLATHRILNWARSQFTYDHEMAMDGLANVDPKSGQLSPGWQAGYITKHGSAPIFDRATGEMKQPDGQSPGREAPQGKSATPATITDDVGYAALPSGAQFVGPDGHTRRKP